jgi:hypothetical protein
MINYGSKKLFVWNDGDKDDYFQELSQDATGAQFSDDGKKLLFWTEREIAVYFTRDWTVQPIRNENETIVISRFSDVIDNVHWSKDYEHVIFTTQGKIKITELDRRDFCNTMNLVNITNDKAYVESNFPEDKLFFTDIASNDSQFFDFYSIDFPEKTGILGLN